MIHTARRSRRGRRAHSHDRVSALAALVAAASIDSGRLIDGRRLCRRVVVVHGHGGDGRRAAARGARGTASDDGLGERVTGTRGGAAPGTNCKIMERS